MKWYKLLSLSIISGLLFAFSWYPCGISFLIFFAFIPLLFLSEGLYARKSKVPFLQAWIWSWPAFFIWNAIDTYWICYSTLPGGIGASFLNSMFMAMVFALWHRSTRVLEGHDILLTRWMRPIVLISLWLCFEFLHLNWDLTWPWLNLGNVFAACPQFVQWYSATGTFGGSLWILVINFLLFYLIKNMRKNRKLSWTFAISAFCTFLVPMLVSAMMFANVSKNIDQSRPVNAIVVQQNTDPWEEQWKMNNTELTQRILDVAKPYLDENTQLIVTAETSIPRTIPLASYVRADYPVDADSYGGFKLMDSVIATHPYLNFILGISTYEFFDHAVSPVAQQIGPNYFIIQHNTTSLYNANKCAGYYHKSRLVPGVEQLPFPKIFGFLGNTLIKLGGTRNSLGPDTYQRSFEMTKPVEDNTMPSHLKVASCICYESIYGELCSKFVQHGANLLCVITNDSWWKDSPGHKQHFEMARLRAIENRRYVLRAANGGFSGVIDPTGKVLQKTKYEERTALKATVYAQDKLTFYTKHGDYIATIAEIVALFCLFFLAFSRLILWGRRRREL